MNITEMELQNLRHLILSTQTEEKKMNAYAQNAQDEQVKQFFQKAAQSAAQNRQTFLEYLR